MTDLRDLIERGPQRATPGPECVFARVNRDLTDEQRDHLSTLLADRRWTATELARELTSRLGVRITDYTLRRHRNRGCACDTR